MREALALAQSPDAPLRREPARRLRHRWLPTARSSGRGYHRGAGTPHAEVVALADAGAACRGATAVVTLEPCRHTGRTGPCTQALLDAGVAARRVRAAGPDGRRPAAAAPCCAQPVSR